uniref:ribonuclease H n=1 Tax=Cyprinus carpio carpio TaxID=630221 RepID=A0A9J8AFQ2_CYPCA
MKSLSISLWNIQGLKSSIFGLKSKNPDFMREIDDLDIIILQETWCRGDESTGCPSGYREIILSSVKLRSTTQGRDSGGKKDIISTSQPVFLCAIYIPPLESPYFQEETFQNLEQEISHFQAQGNVLLAITDFSLLTLPDRTVIRIMSFKWTENSSTNYISATESSEIQSLLHTFQIQEYPKNQFGINQAVKDINYIFYKTAQRSDMTIIKPKKKNLDTDRWFDSDCKALRKNLRNLSNQKHRQPENQELRLHYCEALRKYKVTLRRKKAQFLHDQFEEIEKSINSNKFWDKWKLLNKSNQEDLAIQDGEIWKNHFQELYSSTEIQNSDQNEIIKKLDNLERSIKANQNPLDFPITLKELEDKLRVLEPKKACGVDGILNEMLKHTEQNFKLAILKLFNDVLCVGFFPEIWNQGLISPIHKNGDKLEPNNYRGICVNSNLGKVFCSILNTRLSDFLIKHNALSKCQIGFLPKCRTSDHIFTLQTLIDKYVHQNKSQIFACFIDFKKAFDSIWHEGLFLKLIDSGIGGKFYDLIKSMYTISQCAVKIGNKRTEYFPQRRGVRQGCSLSPTLFNIYINQLASVLEHAPIQGLTLHDTEIKCLLYADDLVLLSPTKEGLQDGLDLLEDYCQTWALTVNLQKTKVMIFQKRSRPQGLTHTFTLSHRTIETTKTYTYLGLKITPTGNFTLAVNELKEKAQRAFYAIKRSIKIDIPIQIWLKLFKSVIEPIVLYGSEVWGPSIKFDFLNWEKHPIENMHLDFCKRILKVQRKTPNNGCRAELGQYPLLLNIQKRAIKFWKHLKMSDPKTYHYKALKHQELSPTTSPLLQLVLRLTEITLTEISQPQDSHTLSTIRPTQIINTEKDKYVTHWTNTIKNQHKLECYSALNREYTMANYLSTVTDVKLRKTLTMYRLSEHSLAVETGRRRQTWLSHEERLCSHCILGEIETELHFLTDCPKYQTIRYHYYPKINKIFPQFNNCTPTEKLTFILGEKSECANIAARFIAACQLLRHRHSQDTNI